MSSSTVLLVEDNEINREMLTRRLTRAGLTVITAADGAAALDAMREAQPGVVLMDMTLPVMDGWEATQRAKAESDIAHIPIIALTAHAMAADKERAMNAGCSEYETKPIDFPSLLAKIYQFLKAADS
jgi:two-component system cell cycle response regulator DivK